MKIVFAVASYWPSTGGVQMVTKYLAEGLAENGHHVVVLTKQLENAMNDDEHCGVKIRRFYEKDIIKFHYGDKKGYRAAVVEECQDADALIAVCASSFAAQWVFPLIGKLPCKCILYQHGMYDGKLHLKRCYSFKRFLKLLVLTPYWDIYHKYYWKSIEKFDGAIHLYKNDSSYNYFLDRGYKKNHVIINSCEEAFFDKNNGDNQVAIKYGIERPYFIYVANFCFGKNQKKSIRIFKKSQCLNTDLVLIGSKRNDYYEKVKIELAKYPDLSDRVHILDAVPRKDTIQLIKNSYACLLTSENEYLPITILEAMTVGKPFISTDVGVVGKIPGGNVCRSDDELSYWMNYYETNPDYVNRLGSIARDFATSNCNLKDKINDLENIIKNIR